MRTFLFSLCLILAASTGLAGVKRVLDGDSIISSDHQSYILPAPEAGDIGKVLGVIGIGSTDWIVGSGISGSGMVNPMTGSGDMIYQNAFGQPTRLPIGIEGSYLAVVSGIPAWVTVTPTPTPVNTPTPTPTPGPTATPTPTPTVTPTPSPTPIVALLLHFDESSGNPVDSGPLGISVTNNGPASYVSSGAGDSGTGFGNAASMSSGSQNFSMTATGTNLQLSTGDWTMDFWFYTGNVTSSLGMAGGYVSGGPQYLFRSGNYLEFYPLSGSPAYYSSTISMTINTWYHIAYEVMGSTLRFFLNGAPWGSTASSSINWSTNGTFFIGTDGISYTCSGCRFDEFRVVKGTAMFPTGGFTRPNAPY